MTTEHNAYPVDPTGPLTVGTIPDEALDLFAATIPAASAALPAGFQADDELPNGRRTYVGTPHFVPGRPAGAHAVVTIDRDGQVHGGVVCVEVGEAQRDLTMREARAFACAVTAAADDLLAVDPGHPLDSISTAAILEHVTRRVAGTGMLREVLAATDPATLTADDRAALLNLFERALASAKAGR